jgi:tRNA 2-selenouridine synthase
VSAYAEIAADRGALAETIARLSTMHSADRIAAWAEMAQMGAVVDLAAELITDHYDPRYHRQRARHMPEVIGSIALSDLSEGQRAEAAARVAEILAR